MDIRKPAEVLNSILNWWIKRNLKIFPARVGFSVLISSFPLFIDLAINTFVNPILKVEVFDDSEEIPVPDVGCVSMDYDGVEVVRVDDYTDVSRNTVVYHFLPFFTVRVFNGMEVVNRLPIKRYNLVGMIRRSAFINLCWRVANKLKIDVNDVGIEAVFGSIPVGWIKSMALDERGNILLVFMGEGKKRNDVYGKLIIYKLFDKKGVLFLEE